LGEFDGNTRVADVLAYVDQLRASPASVDELVDLLPEQSSIYAGRPTGDAELLRGYVLASFEQTGLPQSVMEYVVEDLQSGDNPYVVAAAARAARGAETMPEHIALLLLYAIERIRQVDNVVRLDHAAISENGVKPTTALMELFRTLAKFGPQARIALPALEAMLERHPPVFADDVRAYAEIAVAAISRPHQSTAQSCCADQIMPVPLLPSGTAEIEHVELQDQDGRVFRFRDFFAGRPSILTFFYTRCMNLNKCSLTVTKLARLQQHIRAAGLHGQINVAGVSYDPMFDLPPRLRAYGKNRGMSFDDQTRLMRTTGPFDTFHQRFDLGVGYGTTTVNQHRLDTVLLDNQCHPIASFARVQWREEDILGALKAVLTPAVSQTAVD
jgi:cytochrome oxidase Cu insertion factor (SCO1/SenC/PrrC family)